MSATAILDTILIVIANDVSNRLINDERFATNVARSLLHFSSADEGAAASLKCLLLPAITADESFREFVRQEVSHHTDVITASDSFTIRGDQVVDLDDAVEQRVSEILQRDDCSIKASDIDGLEESIDERIATTAASMSDVEREVSEQMVVGVLAALDTPEGQRAILRSFLKVFDGSAEPVLKAPRSPSDGDLIREQPPLSGSELDQLKTIE
jgi:hypothetical protein